LVAVDRGVKIRIERDEAGFRYVNLSPYQCEVTDAMDDVMEYAGLALDEYNDRLVREGVALFPPLEEH
jgi:hypothetical protein